MGPWGARYLMEHNPEVLGDCLLNGEPSSPFSLRFGEKGLLWLAFTVSTPGAHGAYTLSKYGMSLITLAAAQELREAGVAANTLWPRTIIATAAVQNLLGGDEAVSRARTPEIYADSAHQVLIQPAREYTGQSLIDDEVLAAAGITDLEPYRAGPGDGELIGDLFVDPP